MYVLLLLVSYKLLTSADVVVVVVVCDGDDVGVVICNDSVFGIECMLLAEGELDVGGVVRALLLLLLLLSL